MTRLLLLLLLFSPDFSYATFAAYTVEQVPISQLEKNLQKKLSEAKDPNTKARYLVNLGRLHGMAYTTGAQTGPVHRSRGRTDDEPNFREWLKQSLDLESNHPKFPLEGPKGPITKAQKEHLQKAIEYFRLALKGNPKDYLARLGLGWSLIQAGQKEEAKRVLADLLEEKKEMPNLTFASLRSRVHGAFELSANSKRFTVKYANKVVLNEALMPYLIEQRVKSLRIAGNGRSLSPSKELSIYSKAPTDAIFGKLMAWLKNEMKDERVVAEGILQNGYTFESLQHELRQLHDRHMNRDFLKPLIRKALSATKIQECTDLNRYSVRFEEGTFPLDLVCGARLAWKEKNWGHCREFQEKMSPSEKLPACIKYLAFRSGKPELCQEVREFYKRQGKALSMYDCESYGRRDPKIISISSSFYTTNDWDPNKLAPYLGRMSFFMEPKSATEVEITDLDVYFSTGFISSRERGGNERSRAEVMDLMKFPNGPKIPLEIILADKNGKPELVEKLDIPAPPTAETFGSPPADFAISNAISKAGSAEAALYYSSLLDPVKDKAELDALKKKVWIDMGINEAMPRLVTPLAIALDGSRNVSDILNNKASVSFDLVGNRIADKWTWIKPNAAWLAYRHPKTREPISGMHLFGNSTFWLFWAHGFEPLCALDDTGDDLLQGKELVNLYVWQDRNSNGQEDAGELRTLSDAGITSLDCRHELQSDGTLWNPHGAKLKSGETVPMFDIILRKAN